MDGQSSPASLSWNASSTTPASPTGLTGLEGLAPAAEEPVELFQQYPQELLDFAVAALIAFITIGVPGNFITILALLRYSKARNATAMFIINLSVSDLMFCCFNLPLATSLFYKRAWLHGDALCVLFPFMRYGLLAVSMFTVLAITLNRYIMIGHPRLYPKLYKRRHLIVMIGLTWLGCFGALVPTLLGRWGRFGLDTDIGSCSILQDDSNRSPKEFLFVVAFLLPCLAIIVCYARIFFIVRKAATRSGVSSGRARRSGRPASPSAALETGQPTGGPASSSTMAPSSMRPTYTAGLEPSFHLTCCESLQISGSTEDSEDTPNHSELTKSNTILRWKESRKSSIRIQVEPRSSAIEAAPVDGVATPASTATGVGNSLCLPVDPLTSKERRVSVTFELADDPVDQPDVRRRSVTEVQQFLRVPTAVSNVSLRSAASTGGVVGGSGGVDGANGGHGAAAVDSPRSAPASPDHSEASEAAGGATGGGTGVGGGARAALTSALSALHRRSTVRRSTTGKSRHPGRMTAKDRKLLQMILVIFVAFIVCYLPMTIVKSTSAEVDLRTLNILGYVLIYLTTCINPIIYVVMSSEYRQAYKNLLTCKRNANERSAGRRPMPSRSFSQKA